MVRIFPNAESCLRLIRALAVEIHENWLGAHRYLNMDELREHKKESAVRGLNRSPCHRHRDPFCRRCWNNFRRATPGP